MNEGDRLLASLTMSPSCSPRGDLAKPGHHVGPLAKRELIRDDVSDA